MKFKFVILLQFLLLFAGNLYGQYGIIHTEADSLLRLGTKYIYNVQFDSASYYFDKVIKLYPEHPAGYFMDAMADWWKIRLFRETEKYDKVFLIKVNKVINLFSYIEFFVFNVFTLNALSQ